jgi:hypothetical protein
VNELIIDRIVEDCGGVESVNCAAREEHLREVEQLAGGGRGTIACNQEKEEVL